TRICYRGRTEGHGNNTEFQGRVFRPQIRGKHGANLRAIGRRRQGRSDSQTVAAHILPGAAHTSETTNQSYIRRNQQRSSFAGIDRRKGAVTSARNEGN